MEPNRSQKKILDSLKSRLGYKTYRLIRDHQAKEDRMYRASANSCIRLTYAQYDDDKILHTLASVKQKASELMEKFNISYEDWSYISYVGHKGTLPEPVMKECKASSRKISKFLSSINRKSRAKNVQTENPA